MDESQHQIKQNSQQSDKSSQSGFQDLNEVQSRSVLVLKVMKTCRNPIRPRGSSSVCSFDGGGE